MHTQAYVSGPQFWNPFSNSVVTWQLFLFCFPSLHSDGSFHPSQKINLPAFCFSHPILKLLTTWISFKGISSGTFKLRLFMKSAYSKLVSPTKIDICVFQTIQRYVCRDTRSLMSTYLQTILKGADLFQLMVLKKFSF